MRVARPFDGTLSGFDSTLRRPLAQGIVLIDRHELIAPTYDSGVSAAAATAYEVRRASSGSCDEDSPLRSAPKSNLDKGEARPRHSRAR